MQEIQERGFNKNYQSPEHETMKDPKTPHQESQQQLPESPTSASVKIKSANGFEYIFTMRDEHASTLMFKINAMETKWLELGWTPVAQNAYKENKPASSAPAAITKPCPTHPEEMLKEKISKKSGKKYFSHSKGTYPDLTMCFGQGWQENNY